MLCAFTLVVAAIKFPTLQTLSADNFLLMENGAPLPQEAELKPALHNMPVS
jgi:hypothetical protein